MRHREPIRANLPVHPRVRHEKDKRDEHKHRNEHVNPHRRRQRVFLIAQRRRRGL